MKSYSFTRRVRLAEDRLCKLEERLYSVMYKIENDGDSLIAGFEAFVAKRKDAWQPGQTGPHTNPDKRS